MEPSASSRDTFGIDQASFSMSSSESCASNFAPQSNLHRHVHLHETAPLYAMSTAISVTIVVTLFGWWILSRNPVSVCDWMCEGHIDA